MSALSVRAIVAMHVSRQPVQRCERWSDGCGWDGQEGDKFSLALAKTVNLDNTPTDGTYNAVSLWLVSFSEICTASRMAG